LIFLYRGNEGFHNRWVKLRARSFPESVESFTVRDRTAVNTVMGHSFVGIADEDDPRK
jgi:hypothetical protein